MTTICNNFKVDICAANSNICKWCKGLRQEHQQSIEPPKKSNKNDIIQQSASFQEHSSDNIIASSCKCRFDLQNSIFQAIFLFEVKLNLSPQKDESALPAQIPKQDNYITSKVNVHSETVTAETKNPFQIFKEREAKQLLKQQEISSSKQIKEPPQTITSLHSPAGPTIKENQSALPNPIQNKSTKPQSIDTLPIYPMNNPTTSIPTSPSENKQLNVTNNTKITPQIHLRIENQPLTHILVNKSPSPRPSIENKLKTPEKIIERHQVLISSDKELLPPIPILENAQTLKYPETHSIQDKLQIPLQTDYKQNQDQKTALNNLQTLKLPETHTAQDKPQTFPQTVDVNTQQDKSQISNQADSDSQQGQISSSNNPQTSKLNETHTDQNKPLQTDNQHENHSPIKLHEPHIMQPQTLHHTDNQHLNHIPCQNITQTQKFSETSPVQGQPQTSPQTHDLHVPQGSQDQPHIPHKNDNQHQEHLPPKIHETHIIQDKPQAPHSEHQAHISTQNHPPFGHETKDSTLNHIIHQKIPLILPQNDKQHQINSNNQVNPQKAVIILKPTTQLINPIISQTQPQNTTDIKKLSPPLTIHLITPQTNNNTKIPVANFLNKQNLPTIQQDAPQSENLKKEEKPSQVLGIVAQRKLEMEQRRIQQLALQNTQPIKKVQPLDMNKESISKLSINFLNPATHLQVQIKEKPIVNEVQGGQNLQVNKLKERYDIIDRPVVKRKQKRTVGALNLQKGDED